MSDLELAYNELEDLWTKMKLAEKDYYQIRYKVWQSIAQLKKRSPLKESYKSFEYRVRRDCKKRQRQNYYGKRPRGTQLDHSSIPIFFAYIMGITDLELINGRDNCKWIKKSDNLRKGICREISDK